MLVVYQLYSLQIKAVHTRNDATTTTIIKYGILFAMKDDTYRPKVRVKRSVCGLGLFAEEDITRGQLIIEYTGERISDKEATRRGGQYLFGVTDDLYIDGKGREHTARYINHACKPNAEAEHDEEDDRIYIRAKRKINAGEEITYHYGTEFFTHIIAKKGCQCINCQE